jgi:hypothetical protein
MTLHSGERSLRRVCPGSPSPRVRCPVTPQRFGEQHDVGLETGFLLKSKQASTPTEPALDLIDDQQGAVPMTQCRHFAKESGGLTAHATFTLDDFDEDARHLTGLQAGAQGVQIAEGQHLVARVVDQKRFAVLRIARAHERTGCFAMKAAGEGQDERFQRLGPNHLDGRLGGFCTAVDVRDVLHRRRHEAQQFVSELVSSGAQKGLNKRRLQRAVRPEHRVPDD